MKRFTSSFVLSRALKRIQTQSSANSVRGLARRLGISHVFLSKVLSGSSAVPQTRLKDFVKVFQLDPLAEKQLKDAMTSDLASVLKIEKLLRTPKARKNKKAGEIYEERSVKHQVVLEQWYELPILDYLTCESLPTDIESIAKSLNLKTSPVAISLNKLLASELIFKDDSGRWKKVTNFIRFPAVAPSTLLKHYYTQVLKRTIAELDQTSETAYERRLLINFSIATNSKKIPEIKERLSEFIYNLSVEMAEGATDEVYHLTLGLIPLTKKQDLV